MSSKCYSSMILRIDIQTLHPSRRFWFGTSGMRTTVPTPLPRQLKLSSSKGFSLSEGWGLPEPTMPHPELKSENMLLLITNSVPCQLNRQLSKQTEALLFLPTTLLSGHILDEDELRYGSKYMVPYIMGPPTLTFLFSFSYALSPNSDSYSEYAAADLRGRGGSYEEARHRTTPVWHFPKSPLLMCLNLAKSQMSL